MNYKSNDKCITLSGRQILIFSVIQPEKKYIFRFLDSTDNSSTFFIRHDEIDHEATAKLTLPQPSKDMLRSGMKVVFKNYPDMFVLLETNSLHHYLEDCYQFSMSLHCLQDDLKYRDRNYEKFNIMQIWEGDTLIAQRTEKSKAELKKESLEKQIYELSASINVSVKQMDKLKEEIKSL